MISAVVKRYFGQDSLEWFQQSYFLDWCVLQTSRVKNSIVNDAGFSLVCSGSFHSLYRSGLSMKGTSLQRTKSFPIHINQISEHFIRRQSPQLFHLSYLSGLALL
jgi:hypothetical protein